MMHNFLCSISQGYVIFLYYLSRFLIFVFFSTSQEIGWEEHLQNGLFCVEWNVKP